MQSESRWARAAAVGVPAAVMAVIGAWDLGRGGMWRDEGVTFQVARRSVPQIWRLLHGVDAVHGLYYLLMHAVLALRADEIALRLPSVCGATAAAALVGALGTRLAGAWAGCGAGLLYAVTPMVGYYAQEGRSYALVSAGVLAATLLLARAVDGQGAWRAYAVVLGATCLLHELAALAVCAHALTLACARVRREVWRRWSCAVGAAGAVTLPLALVSRAQSGQVAWLRTPGWASAGRLLSASVPVPTGVLFWGCVALALLGVCAGPRTLTRVALPLALAPPALLITVSRLRPLYDDRYVLYALAGMPLLTAGGCAALLTAARRAARRRATGAPTRPRDPGHAGARSRALVLPGAVALVLGLALVAVVGVALPPHRADRADARRPDDLGALSGAAARQVRQGEPVLFLPAIGRRAALAYPAGFAAARDVALREPAALSGTLYGREVDAVELRRRLAGAHRLWVVAERYALRPGPPPADAAERAKLALLRREFTPAGPLPRPAPGGAILRLYVRRGEGTTARGGGR
ncbi:glycosyltransferase family 39 protein [Streptomyces sp. ACT015]|uniref:glycosyltransferase family 39 protein n=1 Tax=Streptomyces sp. ACT015 TaxID=3134807 RepID=UPI003D178453